MFAKLLKHELKTQSRLMLILSAAALGAGIVGSIMMLLCTNLIADGAQSSADVIGAFFSVLIMYAMYFVVIGYSVAVMIILTLRFYRHLFSDEGYLTFTLPASTHQVLMSSVLSFAIWSAVAGLVTLISAALIFIPFLKMAGSELGMVTVNDFAGLFQGLEINGWYVLLSVFTLVGVSAGGIILPLFSVTLGSVVAKRLKILVAFAFYYGINMTLTIATYIVMIVAMIGDAATSGLNEFYLTLGVPGVLYTAVAVVGYLVMHRLISRKLNLP